jgi:hypothetical protein
MDVARYPWTVRELICWEARDIQLRFDTDFLLISLQKFQLTTEGRKVALKWSHVLAFDTTLMQGYG